MRLRQTSLFASLHFRSTSQLLLTASVALLTCVATVLPGTAQNAKTVAAGKNAPKPDANQANPKADPKADVAPVDEAGIEFFEKKIRPVLVQSCYGCHATATGANAKKPGGGLVLDSRAGLLKGGTTGPALVPGHPEMSRLIEAVSYSKPDMQMPPGKKLPDNVIADLTEWIKRGAPWPAERAVAVATNTPEQLKLKEIEKKKRQHWAFQPVRKIAPPVVKHKAWPRGPIDQFLLAKMEAKGLAPVASADRRTLIRRAYFDLIGLPPTPAEVEAFLADRSPDAWEKLIDHLLASPHYGERWGRYWLDVARYGEDQAHSFQPRMYPQGFRYRDWLAHAFNTDMGYDRFLKEQIAADLLDEPDLRDQLPALGFFALGPVYYGDEKMFDQYDDRIDTLSRGFLGLTVACARCHDHKFDPVSQKDYYALAGVFASTGYVEVALPDEKDKNSKFGRAEACISRNSGIGAKEQAFDKFLDARRTELRDALNQEIARYMVADWTLHNRQKTTPRLSLEEFATKEGLRGTVLERWERYLKSDPAKNRPQLAAWRELIQKQSANGDAKTDLSQSEPVRAEIQRLATGFQEYIVGLQRRRDQGKQQPKNGPTTVSAQEKPQPLDKAETAALDEIVGGDGVLMLPRDQVEKLIEKVTGDDKNRLAALKAELEHVRSLPFVHALTEGNNPANVKVLLRGNPERPGEEAPRHFLTILAGDNPPTFQKGSGRLELANAIADRNNPLTARVMVNRVWQHHFGTGIVRTPSNFGLLGEPPTHPELLDYLTAEFMEHGWSLKTLHKQIMLSAAYKSSGMDNAHNEEIDPDNRLLWRMSPHRLEIEAWRDSMLAVSGKLDETIGGPSQQLTDGNNFRRTYYAAVSRHDLDAMLRLFDYPDPNVTADSRTITTVPLQQLFVLNSEFMVRQAKAFAARLTANKAETDATRIRTAFLLAYGRTPADSEVRLGLAFLQTPPETTPSAGGSAGSSTGAVTKPTATPARTANLSRWEEYAQVLLSANEFMYID